MKFRVLKRFGIRTMFLMVTLTAGATALSVSIYRWYYFVSLSEAVAAANRDAEQDFGHDAYRIDKSELVSSITSQFGDLQDQ